MTLTDLLENQAKAQPDKTALVFEGNEVSFRVFNNRVQSVAEYLVDVLKVDKGDRVAYLGINHPHMLYLVFACSRLGAIFTPLNSRLARDEYIYLINDAEPVVCFYDKNFKEIVSELPATSCKLIPTTTLETTPAKQKQPPVTNYSRLPLLLVYTSGTTGRPKGVVLTQEAVLANIENGNGFYDFQPGQNILITLPLFHVGGLCILLLPALTRGATIYLHARFDPLATLVSLETERITTSILVPAQMNAMMGHESWSKTDLSSLNYIVVGSSLIPMEHIKNWHQRGVPVSQIYGATETGPTTIGMPIGDAMKKEGSAGVPAKLCSIEVRNPDGVVCAPEQNGEIWVKGPNILSKYWRNRTETDKVLKNNWYNTGDIGHVDNDAFYWIVDRSKDVIISGGENICPAEIEAIAVQHPAIEAIAVVGRTDKTWGETPVAAIELKAGETLEEAEFLQFFENKLAKFKRPKSMKLFDDLPRNGMGKIEKSTIRKLV